MPYKHGELITKAPKLTDIIDRIKKDSKKLKEVEDDPTYFEEQRHLYRDNLNTEKQERFQMLSQNGKIFEPRFQRSSRPLKRSLVKANL